MIAQPLSLVYGDPVQIEWASTVSHIFSEFAFIDHAISIEQPPSTPTNFVTFVSLVLDLIWWCASIYGILSESLSKFKQKFAKKWLSSQIHDGSFIGVAMRSGIASDLVHLFYQAGGHFDFLFRHIFHCFYLLMWGVSIGSFTSMGSSLEGRADEVVLGRSYPLRWGFCHHPLMFVLFE